MIDNPIQYSENLRKLNALVKTAFNQIREAKKFEEGPLERLALACRRPSRHPGEWTYEDDIVFPEIRTRAARQTHIYPRDTINNYFVKLHIKACGPYQTQGQGPQDPMKHLVIDLIIKGFRQEINLDAYENIPAGALDQALDHAIEARNGEEFLCAWHLDSHPPEGADPNTISRLSHPRYHWQYGGSNVWGRANTWYGSHLLMSSPRLMHPPLDILLAIDFVLSHFYYEAWEKLCSEATYKQIIFYAQKTYWQPFFKILANDQYWRPNVVSKPFLYWH